jgi:antitoxin component of MazEF toxin-antitoxin module
MQQRHKRLCTVGNSLALIIDKPILRAMGLGTATELRVYTDGTRIIAERVRLAAHDPHLAARRAFEAKMRDFHETAQRLVNWMGPSEMQKLGAKPVALVRFQASMSYSDSCSARDHVILDRLEHVRAGLDSGLDLYAAIDRAIAAVPGLELGPPTA